MASIANPALDSQSKANDVIALTVVAVTFSSVAVALRLYTRVKILKGCGLDDLLILITLVFAIGTSITVALQTRYGLGRHVWVVPEWQAPLQMKVFYASIIIYNLAMALLKMSFLMQYARIFTSPKMLKTCRFCTFLVAGIGIGEALLLSLQCTPARGFWDFTIKKKCLTPLPGAYVISIINLVTDFLIFILPLPVLNTLHLPQRQKIVVFGLFCLGFFTCTISVIRLCTLKGAYITHDPTWDNTGAACWSVVELNVGIICCCLPILRALIVKHFPGISKIAQQPDSSYSSNIEIGPRSSEKRIEAVINKMSNDID